jgi:hypothetical protein
MSGVTGAIVGGAVIGGVATVAASQNAKSGAENAAATAAKGQENAIASQKEAQERGLGILGVGNDAAQKTLAPYVEGQKKAYDQLQGFTDPSNPLYNQERDFATKQIEAHLAAQGLLRSRSQGDSLANLELGLNQQRLGITQGLANSGDAQRSAALSAGTAQNAAALISGFAPNISSSLAGLAQITAQGQLAGSQAVGSGLAGLNNTIQGTIGNYISQQQYQQILSRINGLGSSVGDGGPSTTEG